MLFKRIESEGLAHYSYIIGDKGEAIVIDPRRDIDIYLEEVQKQGYRIAYVLETHRNEDYLIGSLELAAAADCEMWHADSQWDYQYGNAVKDGQIWKAGGLKVEAVHAPGHTPGMMNYLLYCQEGSPWMFFSGDTLFAGEVGRVDLMGRDRLEEMAGLLYDTIYDKILPLGDDIILCPAHGHGSVCGAAISKRMWTTIGLERRINPRLQYENKDEFVVHTAKYQEHPPYFQKMEEWNTKGPVILGALPAPTPMLPEDFANSAQSSFVLDTRSMLAFGAAHVPGALSIWEQGVPSFAGWFLPYDLPILSVNQQNDYSTTVRYLIRLGFDNLPGYLSGEMLDWNRSGRESQPIKLITTQELCRRLDADEEAWILDVRSIEELEKKGRITAAHHIHITQLPEQMHRVSRRHYVYIFCDSGLRSMIAASLLQREGWTDLYVVLGGLTAWNSTTCPVQLYQ